MVVMAMKLHSFCFCTLADGEEMAGSSKKSTMAGVFVVTLLILDTTNLWILDIPSMHCMSQVCTGCPRYVMPIGILCLARSVLKNRIS